MNQLKRILYEYVFLLKEKLYFVKIWIFSKLQIIFALIFIFFFLSIIILQLNKNTLTIYDPNFLIAISTSLYVFFTFILLSHEMRKHRQSRFAILDVALKEQKKPPYIKFYVKNVSQRICKNLTINFYVWKESKHVYNTFSYIRERMIPEETHGMGIDLNLRQYFKKLGAEYLFVIIEIIYYNDIESDSFKDIIRKYHVRLEKNKLILIDQDKGMGFNIRRIKKNHAKKFKKILYEDILKRIRI